MIDLGRARVSRRFPPSTFERFIESRLGGLLFSALMIGGAIFLSMIAYDALAWIVARIFY
jgi:hypothetical protein